jgi:hypothetical protein
MEPVRQSILLRPARCLPYKNAETEEECFRQERAKLEAMRVQREERHDVVLRSLHCKHGHAEKEGMRQKELELIEAKRLAEMRERDDELAKELKMNAAMERKVNEEDIKSRERQAFVRSIALENKELIGYRKELVSCV